MTPRFLPNHPGGCEINGIQKSREKQYWKGFGIKLSLLTILTLIPTTHKNGDAEKAE